MNSKILGGRTLRRKLQRMPKEIKKAVIKEVVSGAELIKITAQLKIPNQTGNLSKALHVKKTNGGLSVIVGYWKKGNIRKWRLAGWRAHFTEYGTKSYKKGETRFTKNSKTTTKITRNIPARPARPFMGPAYLVNERKIVLNIENSVDKALRKASEL